MTDVPDGLGYFYAQFRRRNPLPYKTPYLIVDEIKGQGHYVGTALAWGVNNNGWWGEGEIKFYLDGDSEFPTICGTGSEDWAGFSHGIGKQQFAFHGSIISQGRFHAMYRWHLPDPIVWQRECRITMQQITYRGGVSETEDDWSVATFWYEPLPSRPLPPLPDAAARTADLWEEAKQLP